MLPLLRQVAQCHAAGLVAPLEGPGDLRADDGRLYFEADKAGPPRSAGRRLRALERSDGAAFDTFGHRVQTTDADDGEEESEDLQVGAGEDAPDRPQYVPGYRSWEHLLGHHDALTDIHVLGQLLARLACGFDFETAEGVARFAAERTNPFVRNPQLNPVVARQIEHLTALDRHRRCQDLVPVIRSLETYRDQVVDLEVDLEAVPGFRTADQSGRRAMVLARLRERLFEVSRRNRLLYFKPTLQTVNLTFASVPILLDPSRIAPEQLFTWQPAVEQLLASQAPITLNKYLRFEDAPYLPSVLDRLISDARRDTAEFGFSQLRLVVAFLRWHDLKEPTGRIDSPLLLVPVDLTRKKGVRDSYVLRASAPAAEVNPVLRYHLKQLYGIELPVSIDLTETTVQAFHDTLVRQVQATEPGVTVSRLDRPQVEMVHARARRRLDQYRRRIRIGGPGLRAFDDLEYSYERDNYQPLGLRLFLSRVRPSPAPLHDLFRRDPVRVPHVPHMAAEPPAPQRQPEAKKTFVSVRDGGDAGNPYAWDFDLCSVTLGSFNYRRVSLVRDFDSLLASGQVSRPFDTTFSLTPRPAPTAPPAVDLAALYPVVACDPTQLQALATAQAGESFIVQGPPGTGKSQTITNLVADLVARGQRVLFVCEKRAAIDVVYDRLQQRGLQGLACLVHDSQADKREFIADLKQTYEALLRPAAADDGTEARRRAALRALRRALRPIDAFEAAMRDVPERAGLSLRALLLRLVELATAGPPAAVDPAVLPPYREWRDGRAALQRLDRAVREVRPDGVYARHPLARLSPRTAGLARPRLEIQAALRAARGGLADLLRQAGARGIDLQVETLDRLAAAARLAGDLVPLAQRGLLALLDAASALSLRLTDAAAERAALEAALQAAEAAAAAWRTRLAPDDLSAALEQARSLGSSPLRFLQPAFWRLRGVLRASYDFARHAVRPSFTQVLERLQRTYAARAARDAAAAAHAAAFRTDAPAADLARQVDGLRARAQAAGLGPDRAAAWIELRPAVEPLLAATGLLFDDTSGWTPARLDGEIARIERDEARLPEWLPCLEQAALLPEAIARLVATADAAIPALEHAVARETCAEIFRRDRDAARFDGRTLMWQASEVGRAYAEWLEANAAVVVARNARRFRDHVARAAAPSVRLSREDEEWKRGYNAGRRELEHEFGKTMRYKSVRGLLAGPAGRVILDLKPVWLMSPLSVSDTLPIDTAAFDVVVFDEASQVPLEEAVPALFRADQVVISGDQMQLPPTNFFSATRGGEDDLLLEDEDTGVFAPYALDSDSFLSHASRNLASTLLGWHYRSRSEALISFSNAAFYEGRLLTVPDRRRPVASWSAIEVAGAEDASLARVLDRPVGFHFLRHGRYENRRNDAEAAYIAQLVRALFAASSRPSLAVVAFSEAQQGCIEAALERLALADPAFRTRLDEEYEREDDGQFAGLLVKNLENIQGDERDVVIMSICYGPGPDGRVLMNFGPINQSGGEKRLNVAFSRARHHMVVVSSMRYTDVRNVYNDGASALRHYLQYTAAMSEGDLTGAGAVLHGLSGGAAASGGRPAPSGRVAAALRDALEQAGLVVETALGQSHFVCDLAVRRPDDADHRVAVFVEEDAASPATELELVERASLRPDLLRRFGWAVVPVLVKDWLEAPEETVRRIVERLDGERPPDPAGWDGPPPDDEDLDGDGDDAVDGSTAPPDPGALPPLLPPGSARYFEMIAGGSRKFWHVTVDGVELVVSFGRIGTDGQVKRKAFASESLARREADRLVREKLAKGYVEKPPGA
jgi:predicted DNA-binding WGR domain protein